MVPSKEKKKGQGGPFHTSVGAEAGGRKGGGKGNMRLRKEGSSFTTLTAAVEGKGRGKGIIYQGYGGKKPSWEGI